MNVAKYVYIVHSDINENNIYAEFATEEEAIEYAKRHKDELTYVDKVEVTLDEEGTITNVEVKDHNESVNDIEQVPLALEEVPARIVESNSAEVDITSGATATSNGIMEAVEDALSKAE